MRSLWLASCVLVLLAGLFGVACRASDPSFASPADTARTLLRSHGLDAVRPGQLRARMAHGERLRVVDRGLLAACFIAFRDTPVDHGLAGFVVGALAFSRGRWAVERQGDDATLRAGERGRVAMRRTPAGWKIDLGRSVPAAFRARFVQLASRVMDRHAREGIPEDF